MSINLGSLNPLEEIAERARAYLDAKNQARERALARSREVIRASANAIRAAHRRDFDRAAQLLGEARQALESAVTSLGSFGDVLYAGFISDAQKEYTEASIVFALLRGNPLPAPTDLEVGWPAYLNGLAESVGELRRFLLDALRRGDLSLGEPLLQAMDDIYDVLVTMDYPDAITGGLRRSTDVARGILEKTRGDLTVAMRQAELEAQMRVLEARLSKADPQPQPIS